MQRAGLSAAVENLERLSGGASMESWRFNCGAEAFVLRRAPSAEWLAERPIDLSTEAEVIRVAESAAVRVPKVVITLEPSDDCGIGYVMRCLAGTAEPSVVLKDPKSTLVDEIAGNLARIHSVELDKLPKLPRTDPAEGVESLVALWEEFGADRPIIALGLAWLRSNLPDEVTPTLVHGDLRIGNIMVDAGHITGVLDWEMVHIGDYHEDLAYGCMTVWRFGKLDKPAFGCTDLDSYFAAYSAAGGRPIERSRFHFWLVYRTVWWALACLKMGSYWREGSDRSIERVVISRRTSEQEADILLLLEHLAPETERKLQLPPPRPRQEKQKGEASSIEMLIAIDEWLDEAVKPLVSGRTKFNLAVARNALGIVRREIEILPVASNPALAADLMTGRVNLATPGMLARLRRLALDKLASDMPKYPALEVARANWEGT